MTPLEYCAYKSAELGEHNDCSVRAVTLACSVPYETARAALRVAGRQPRQGALDHHIKKAVRALGHTTGKYIRPKQANGSKYTPKTITKAYPQGRYLVYTRDHVFALVNGKVLDWTEGRRHHIIAVQEVLS